MNHKCACFIAQKTQKHLLSYNVYKNKICISMNKKERRC